MYNWLTPADPVSVLDSECASFALYLTIPRIPITSTAALFAQFCGCVDDSARCGLHVLQNHSFYTMERNATLFGKCCSGVSSVSSLRRDVVS